MALLIVRFIMIIHLPISPYNYLGHIESIKLLRNNKILVIGGFSHINNVRRTGIALLNNTAPVAGTNYVKGNTAPNKVIIAPNPVAEVLTIKSGLDISKADLFTTDGRLLQSYKVAGNKCDVSDLPAGIYLVKMHSGNDVFNAKIIKK